VEYTDHQINKPSDSATGLVTISTPGPTPLRTHMTVSTPVDTSGTTLPSLLPATGTTLILPPSSMSSTVQYPTTSTIVQLTDIGPTSTTSSYDLEGSTAYDSPPSSPTSIQTISNKPNVQLHLPVSAIAVISATGFFVGVIFFLWLFWLRTPRRRRIPIPSLPKLENGDIEEKHSSTESPLFGPKERFSQRTELHPQWSWVTYPQNKSTCEGKSQGANNHNLRTGSTSVPRLPDAAITSHRKSSSIYTTSGQFQSLSAPVGSPQLGAGHPSLQQVQAAITRATNRMSAMSFTCASKYPDENSRDSNTAFTADGHNVMKRRSRTPRKSRSNSIYEDRHLIRTLDMEWPMQKDEPVYKHRITRLVHILASHPPCRRLMGLQLELNLVTGPRSETLHPPSLKRKPNERKKHKRSRAHSDFRLLQFESQFHHPNRH